MRRWIAVALLTGAACSPAPSPPVELELRIAVDDGDGAPAAGVRITADGDGVARTDPSGRAALQLRGPAGRVVRLAVECPPPARPRAPASIQLVLRRQRALGDEVVVPPRQVRFGCLPPARSHLLVVRTDHRGGLPIRVTGGTAGRTDALGVAQLVVRGAAGEEIEVVVDTSQHPRLRPASPSRRLRLPARGSVLIFDQEFSERRQRGGTRRASARAAGPRRL